MSATDCPECGSPKVAAHAEWCSVGRCPRCGAPDEAMHRPGCSFCQECGREANAYHRDDCPRGYCPDCGSHESEAHGPDCPQLIVRCSHCGAPRGVTHGPGCPLVNSLTTTRCGNPRCPCNDPAVNTPPQPRLPDPGRQEKAKRCGCYNVHCEHDLPVPPPSGAPSQAYTGRFELILLGVAALLIVGMLGMATWALWETFSVAALGVIGAAAALVWLAGWVIGPAVNDWMERH